MTTQKKPKIIGPLIASLIELSVVIYAVYSGLTGARNLVYFDAVINALLFIPIFIKTAEEAGKDQRPEWVLLVHDWIDTTIVIALVWNGWLWCAVFLALGAIASAGYRHRNPEADEIL